MMLSTRVAGIPCLVEPTRVLRVKGTCSWNAPSDLDYHGYTEVEFNVCDRRGRPAPWLERKLCDDDVMRIEQEILEYWFEDDRY
jgi:hypothetical protein